MKRLLLLLMAICSVVVMLYFSSRNADVSSNQSQIILDIISNLGIKTSSYFIRKLAHFIIFAIIGFCATMFIGNCIGNNHFAVTFSFLLSSCYACIDEYIQTYIPGRCGCIGDVFLDIGGIIAGIFLYIIICNFLSNN